MNMWFIFCNMKAAPYQSRILSLNNKVVIRQLSLLLFYDTFLLYYLNSERPKAQQFLHFASRKSTELQNRVLIPLKYQTMYISSMNKLWLLGNKNGVRRTKVPPSNLLTAQTHIV